jgi:hypothetical protein
MDDGSIRAAYALTRVKLGIISTAGLSTFYEKQWLGIMYIDIYQLNLIIKA